MKKFDDVRLLETVVVGHGPLWLDYLATALAPLCRRLTVCFPELPQYTPLKDASKSWSALSGTDVRLEPITWRGADHLEHAVTLERACAPGADLTVLTFLDILMRHQTRIPPGLQAGRPEIWGVWFNPLPRDSAAPGLLRRFFSRAARERRRARRILDAPPDWLDGAFFLDQSLADRAALDRKRILPDPWPTRSRQPQAEAREALGLPRDAKLFLHFGVDGRRKGLGDLIKVWGQLPKVAILLRAGPVGRAHRRNLEHLVRKGRAVVHDRFIAEEQVDLYFRAADWVLLSYRSHEGSSGILSAAAAAQRPVIAADYGVVGKRVRDGDLGVLYENASQKALAAAVVRASEIPVSRFSQALDAYAEARTLPAFREAVRSTWR